MQHVVAPPETLQEDRPVILLGNPNVGKSALFGAFTGRRVDVSNYPGTTVEITRGAMAVGPDSVRLIDTPGVYSLLPRSPDEQVARDVLRDEDPLAVIQVADSKNLRRTLLLTFQIAEYEMPFILALNMADEADALGIEVDYARLAQILGADVVRTVAVRGEGLEELRAALHAPRPIAYQVRYDGAIEGAVQQIVALLPAAWRGRRGIALAALAGDESALPAGSLPAAERAAVADVVAATAARYDRPLAFVLTQQRLRCANCLLQEVWQPPPARLDTWADKLDRLMVHPFWGWPFLGLVLVVMYLFVGQIGAGILVDWLEGVVFGQWINPAATWLVGLIPIPLVQDFFVGPYGIVTMALAYGFAIVLPIVFTFFLAFSILEDTGYLPRLAVMANRPFKAIGLNGKAVLPMVLGLGCDTMATLTTRILETRKERLQVTLLLALGVPCSAQLGVLLGMVAILSPVAVLVWLSVILLTMLIVGWLAARVMPGRASDFVLELPPIRVPMLRHIVIKTLARIEWYLREVLPLFILGAVILFTLDRLNVLGTLESAMAPVVSGLLGLPEETAGVFLVGFLRRDFGAAGLFDLARQGLLTANQIVVSLVVVTLFVPCIANLLMIAHEHGRRTAVYVALFVFPFAFAVGGLLHLALQTFGIVF